MLRILGSQSAWIQIQMDPRAQKTFKMEWVKLFDQLNFDEKIPILMILHLDFDLLTAFEFKHESLKVVLSLGSGSALCWKKAGKKIRILIE